MTYLLDTNVFIEFLLEQENADEAGELLEKMSAGFGISLFALYSIGIILTRRGRASAFLQLVEDIEETGTVVVQLHLSDMSNVITAMQQYSLDFDDAELNYAREPHTDETAERLYLRKWARALTSEAMLALEQDFARRNKAGIFKAIKPYLAGGDDYEKLAGSIQLTVSNAKVTVHRARKRYGELLRAAVRDTVQADSDVDAELRELMDSL